MTGIITIVHDSDVLLQLVTPRLPPGGMRVGSPEWYGVGISFCTGESVSIDGVRSQHKIKTRLLEWADEQRKAR